ncbi:hypothetical protein DFR71_6612 [Nocardia alba]|uniref:DUF7691 domain-containing protein n=2 Tax=Nocardia alba TaxID=225051 RepID=A0A4R1FET0_9NOCA|nr:hypothetical protein DFR71_6612 [Nocardia alba]
MGYGIMAYSVRIEHLRAPSTFASEPAAFYDWMVGLHSSAISSAQRRTALRELFFSEPHSGTDGADYGYALKVLCERFGGSLNNEYWYPIGSSGLDTVGQELARLGVKLDPADDLAFAGAPVPIPEVDDFPGIGYLTCARMNELAPALDAANLSVVGDPYVRGAIAEIQQWIHHCTEDGSDLVTFYH